MSDPSEFYLRTPERSVTVVRGHLRDAAIAISQSVTVVDAVVSAFQKEDQSRPVLTGYLSPLCRACRRLSRQARRALRSSRNGGWLPDLAADGGVRHLRRRRS